MAATREAVALALEAHKLYLAAQPFQGGEELLGLLDIAAQVLLAVQDQQRRVDVLYVRNGRELHVTLQVVPRRRLKLVVGEDPAEVATAEA